jgi:hypothetical protein
MTITIKNARISNCVVGIVTEGIVDMEISDINIEACSTAIHHQNSPGVLQALGLPANTPPDLLIEALELLLNHQSPKKSLEVLSKSRLFQGIGNASDATSLLSNLVSLQQSGLVQSFLNMLPR